MLSGFIGCEPNQLMVGFARGSVSRDLSRVKRAAFAKVLMFLLKKDELIGRADRRMDSNDQTTFFHCFPVESINCRFSILLSTTGQKASRGRSNDGDSLRVVGDHTITTWTKRISDPILSSEFREGEADLVQRSDVRFNEKVLGIRLHDLVPGVVAHQDSAIHEIDVLLAEVE